MKRITIEDFKRLVGAEDEPDQLEFEHAGLSCELRRVDGGHWCGYVAVPEGHPLHGKHGDENLAGVLRDAMERRMEQPIGDAPSMSILLAAVLGGDIDPTISNAINVHGGVTWTGPKRNDDRWFIGFDCSHSGDLSSHHFMLDGIGGDGSYRSMAYARRECESLAEQIASVVPA